MEEFKSFLSKIGFGDFEVNENMARLFKERMALDSLVSGETVEDLMPKLIGAMTTELTRDEIKEWLEELKELTEGPSSIGSLFFRALEVKESAWEALKKEIFSN